MVMHSEAQAFCLLPTDDLQSDIHFFTSTVGFKLTALIPASEPEAAELSGFGLLLRLDKDYPGAAPTLLINTQAGKSSSATSPGGTKIHWVPVRRNVVQKIENHQLEICTLRGTPWLPGKAGTHRRDLIPSRLTGGMAATHIRIPNGGLVADHVHYHTGSFQLVFCVRGWIKLVFEDQGDPITLYAGDCVTQPPHIRHKVLETSNGLEVIEIAIPAEHVTSVDNDMELPNGRVDSHRLFGGQRFCHHQMVRAKWQPHRLPGFSFCDTGVDSASSGMVSARVLRASSLLPAYTVTHDATVLFSYVLAGSVRIDRQLLVAGDAFTIPPDTDVRIGEISSDAHILEVSAPGSFQTSV